MSNIPRVLLISYHFPPRPSIGSLRTGGLVKYLPQFGWDSIVLAPQLPAGARPPVRLIETDYRDVLADVKARLGMSRSRGLHDQLGLSFSTVPGSPSWHTRVIDWIASMITFPDDTKGWIPFAKSAIDELARTEKIDLIITSSPPITTNLLGAHAKKVLKCPWIADLRDLWAGPPSPLTRNAFLHKRLELKTLGQADALVSVSDAWADFLRERYRSKPVSCIVTGFDAEDQDDSIAQLTRHFSITYAGNLYAGRRDPTLLFQVLQDLFQHGLMSPEFVRVRFYGSKDSWLLALIERYGLQGVVEVNGAIPRNEVLQRQTESQILLLLAMNVATDAGCYPGKLFEYLAARRPIMAIGGLKGATSELLTKTGAGAQLFSPEEIRNFLVSAYQQYRDCGSVTYAGISSEVEQYSHRDMARKFGQLFDSLRGVRASRSRNDVDGLADQRAVVDSRGSKVQTLS
jgi:glycosyltransferase involved in cell wall biosynthesis